MAQLSDIPRVMRTVGPLQLAKRVYTQMGEDSLLALAAALAYAWLFAIFPFLLFLLSLLPYLPERTKQSAKTEIGIWLYSTLSDDAATTIWQNIGDILSRPHRSLAGFGLILMLWASSGGMNMTITALDRCYELHKGRQFYKQRLLAIVLTIIVAVLIVALLVLLPIGTIAIHWIESTGNSYISKPLLLTWSILRYPAALLLMFIVVHVIYQYGPAIRQRFCLITPGAVFTVAVWIILGFAFRLYVNKFGKYNETYGTVGGVVVLLLFFYIEAAVLLIGAEINSEIDFEVLGVERGSRDFRTTMPKGFPLAQSEAEE